MISGIHADAMYRSKDLRALGIGDQALSQARRSGVVKPREVGRWLWYYGAELIEWMKHQERAEATQRTIAD